MNDKIEPLDFDVAIVNGEVVGFNYRSGEGENAYWKLRIFSPWEVKGDSVIGWDHGADEIRRFRFDRMGQERPDQVRGESYVTPTN